MQRMGRATLALLKQPERWVHRRSERIRFIDHGSAHHEITVDFTLPTGIAPIGEFCGNDVYVAPLFMLAKDASPTLIVRGRAVPRVPFTHVNLVDQAGSRLPLLTRRQSGRLGAVVLREAATMALGQAPSDEVRAALSDIALGTRARRARGLAYLFRAPLPAGDCRHVLRSDPFRELAFALSSHSLIVCLFTRGIPDRSIVRLAYDEPFAGNRSPWWAKWFRSFGWKSQQYFVALNEIGASATYHVEIDVPRELELNETGLYGTRYEHFRRNPRGLPEGDLHYDILQPQSATEGSIYVPEPLRGRRVGAVWVKLRARRPGFLRSALAASVVTSTVLFAMLAAAGRIVRADREAAVALLLLVPTILVAYVARSDEHPITTRMLTWARVTLMLDAALPFAAALLLMTGPSGSPSVAQSSGFVATGGMLTVPMAQAQAQTLRIEARRAAERAAQAERRDVERLRWGWGVLAFVSLLVIAQFVATMIWPHPRGKPRYRPFPKTVDPVQ